MIPKGAEPVSRDDLTQTLIDAGVSQHGILDSLATTVASTSEAVAFCGVAAGALAEDGDGTALSYSGTTSAVVLDEEAFDADSPYFDTDGFWQSDGTFEVPAGKDGYYRVDVSLAIGCADFKGATLAAGGVQVRVNGADAPVPLNVQQFLDPEALGAREINPVISGTLSLAAGDTVDIRGMAYTIDPSPPTDGYPVVFTIYCASFSLTRIG